MVHITPNMTWYNDMVIFNNLSPLQLNKYLYIFVGEFGFCLLKILSIVAITYIILQIYYGQDFFHATFLTNIFTGSPIFDLNGAIILCRVGVES